MEKTVVVSQHKVCSSSGSAGGSSGLNHVCALSTSIAHNWTTTHTIICEKIENTFLNDTRLPIGLFDTRRRTGSVRPIAIVTVDVMAKSIQRN